MCEKEQQEFAAQTMKSRIFNNELLAAGGKKVTERRRRKRGAGWWGAEKTEGKQRRNGSI